MSVNKRKEIILMKMPSQPEGSQQTTVSRSRSATPPGGPGAYAPSGDSSTRSYSRLQPRTSAKNKATVGRLMTGREERA